jgi:hypothetical protein
VTTASPTKTGESVGGTTGAKVVLSKTAIIGIAVGGGAVLILLLLGVGCCCWKCCCGTKRNKRQEDFQSYEPYRAVDAAPQNGNNLQKMEMQVLGNFVSELEHRH